MGTLQKLKHAWNAFRADETRELDKSLERNDAGMSYSSQPYRRKLTYSNERSIISSIYTRLAIDVAAVAVKHVRLDENGQYSDDVVSGLNDCLTVEANIDQGARAFRQDIAFSLFDKGVVAIVPVDTTMDPLKTGSYDIQSMRVGEIMTWKPQYVQVRVYNDRTGMRKDIWLPKSTVAIVENPLYAVMNEPNSTLRRLIHKLNLLDTIDDAAASNNLDLIIQLPYVIKTEMRRQEAEKRRKDIEMQLRGSQYGIAYTDGTEKITQLNRPAENNLLAQVEYLTKMLYSQLGLTDEIMNGTATPDAKLDYHNRTIEPVLAAITEGIHRTFLTKTARSQGQAIIYLYDPLKIVPVNDLAELFDVLSRNEIMSANDLRPILGRKPSKQPNADSLANKNMPVQKRGVSNVTRLPLPAGQSSQPSGELQNGT
jgi:portal protein